MCCADSREVASEIDYLVAERVADILPMIFGSDGAVLDAGRSRRTISPLQRAALNVRDKGCRFPGCDRPPAWCQGHHRKPWSEGGRTDLKDLAS